jgi:predicted short-subunit dehydrogenase-like oxidoreductase (DUF2520 family)
VAIIGAGRVGTALAVLLGEAGHRIVAASGRDQSRRRVEEFLPGTEFSSAPEAARAAEVVIIGVVDDLIARTCAEIADAAAVRPGQRVIHLSGSLPLDILEPARRAGADVLSLHPFQSFPDVDTGIERLEGSGVAVTAHTESGYRFGESLARDMGGVPFRLTDDVKPLYHSAAVFCANYLVTVQGVAERLLRLAGVEDPLGKLAPLARTAHDRTFAFGPMAALTGPAVRGDVGTIERHLEALSERAPEAVEAYVALARLAAVIASASGRLPGEPKSRVEETLDAWR